MKSCRLLGVFLLICSFPAYAQESSLPLNDSNAMLTLINRVGANVIMKQLVKEDQGCGPQLDTLLAHVETGDEAWLKVADKLDCCIDACVGESFSIAWAAAFIHSPEAILRRRSMDSLSGICTVPFIEPTKTQFDKHVKAVKVALRHVKDLALQDKRKECGKLINAIGPWRDVSK